MPSILNGNEDILRRARLTVSYILIFIIASLLYMAIYIWMGSQVSAAILEVAVLIAVLNLYFMHKFGVIAFVNNILISTLFLVFTVMATRLGGFDATIFAWYVVVPLTALSLSGKRSAFFWLVVTTISTIVFYILYINGYSFPNDLKPTNYKILIFIGWIGFFIVIFLLTLQFEITKDQMVYKLQNSERRLLDITNSMGEWIWEIDTEWNYTHSSGNVESFLGYSNEEIVGKSPFCFMDDKEKERVRKILSKIYDNKEQIIELESWSTAKNGKYVCTVATGVPVFKNDIFMGYRGVSKNVTRQKKINNKLREQTRELVNSNQELKKSRMVALSIMQDTEIQKNKVEKALTELGAFNEAMVNREMRLIELKEEVNKLAKKLKQSPPYNTIWKDVKGTNSE